MKFIALIMCLAIPVAGLFAQVDSARVVTTDNQQVYHIRNGIDLPLTAATTAFTLYGFTKIYGGDKTSEAVILALDPNDVNSLDRPVTRNFSPSAKDASDKFFYGSMPLPLVFLLDKKMRKDALQIGLLYLQATSVFGTLYTSSSMIARRFRPYTYNPQVDINKRTGGGGRNSFPAGHPGFVATSTFFMAKVYSDYHPDMRNKWILYTIAGSASLATGILRIKAGEHFITDVSVGLPIGVLTGLLVPHFHKNRVTPKSLTLVPTFEANRPGFYASWNFAK